CPHDQPVFERLAQSGRTGLRPVVATKDRAVSHRSADDLATSSGSDPLEGIFRLAHKSPAIQLWCIQPRLALRRDAVWDGASDGRLLSSCDLGGNSGEPAFGAAAGDLHASSRSGG